MPLGRTLRLGDCSGRSSVRPSSRESSAARGDGFHFERVETCSRELRSFLALAVSGLVSLFLFGLRVSDRSGSRLPETLRYLEQPINESTQFGVFDVHDEFLQPTLRRPPLSLEVRSVEERSAKEVASAEEVRTEMRRERGHAASLRSLNPPVQEEQGQHEATRTNEESRKRHGRQ